MQWSQGSHPSWILKVNRKFHVELYRSRHWKKQQVLRAMVQFIECLLCASHYGKHLNASSNSVPITNYETGASSIPAFCRKGPRWRHERLLARVDTFVSGWARSGQSQGPGPLPLPPLHLHKGPCWSGLHQHPEGSYVAGGRELREIVERSLSSRLGWRAGQAWAWRSLYPPSAWERQIS